MGLLRWMGRICGIQTQTRRTRSENRVSDTVRIANRKIVHKIDFSKVIHSKINKRDIKISQYTPRK
jgi:hypothetical protein